MRRARQSAGYSAEEFAAIAGIDRAYYAKMENGLHNFSIAKLYQVAQALDVELEAISLSMKQLRKLEASEAKD